MLGSSLSLALAEATPAGSRKRNEVIGFYREVNQKLASGDYFYGNPVQLSKYSSQLGKFRKGDPLAPFSDEEMDLTSSYKVVGAYLQEVRLLFNVLKRRVRNTIKDDGAVETFISWYTPASYTIAAKFDSGDPASLLLARLAALFPMRLDLFFSFGLVFNTYKDEAKIIKPVLTSLPAVNRLTYKLKQALSEHFDVEFKKFRLSFGDADYVHPVFYLTPKDEALESVRNGSVSFVGLPTQGSGLKNHPMIKKLYDALSTYSVGGKVEDEDEEKIKDLFARGREAEIPEGLVKLADEIFETLGRA